MNGLTVENSGYVREELREVRELEVEAGLPVRPSLHSRSAACAEDDRGTAGDARGEQDPAVERETRSARSVTVHSASGGEGKSLHADATLQAMSWALAGRESAGPPAAETAKVAARRARVGSLAHEQRLLQPPRSPLLARLFTPPPTSTTSHPRSSPSPSPSPSTATADAADQHGPKPNPACEPCAACDRPIGGYFSVKALGRLWHADHLRCARCTSVLADLSFFHRDAKLYCRPCWRDGFSPTCDHCRKPIMETCVRGAGKHWHPSHFFCAHCGSVLAPGEPYVEHKGRAYCEADYYHLFSPVCYRCDKAITEDIVFAMERKWHPNCLTCETCSKPLSNGTFFDLHGEAYCEAHYHQVKGSICSACNQPIVGRCLNVMGKKYHTEHFVCSLCSEDLGKAAFREGPGEKPYCVRCYERLFAKA